MKEIYSSIKREKSDFPNYLPSWTPSSLSLNGNENEMYLPLQGLQLQVQQQEKEKLESGERLSHLSEPFKNSLFSHWYGFIKLLRIVGNFPVTIKTRNSTLAIKSVEFKFLSVPSLYSFLIGILRLYLYWEHYKNWGARILGHEFTGKGFDDWMIMSMNIAFPIFHIWDMLASWINSGKAAKLCNNWIEYELKFFHVFGEVYEYKCTINKLRHTLLLVSILPVVGISGISVLELIKTFWESRDGDVIRLKLLHVLTVSLFLIIATLEDLKVLLMYKTMSEAYKNLCNGIERDVNITGINNVSIGRWTNIFLILRKQGLGTGLVQSAQQLVTLLVTMMVVTQGLFLLIKSTFNGTMHLNAKFIFAVIGFTYVVRLLIKIIMAADIETQEQKLGAQLIKIDSVISNVSEKLEIQKLINIIYHKPIRISFAGYIVMEKRLIPKIMGYVIAYLVVLIQFHLAYMTNGTSGHNNYKESPNITNTCFCENKDFEGELE